MRQSPLRETTRHARRDRDIPARDIFPPLPSQSVIWQEETAAWLARNARQNAVAAVLQARGRLSLPALPVAELLLPFGMLMLSLLR